MTSQAKQRLLFALTMVLLLMILLNSTHYFTRFDLSVGGVHSLSPVSQNLVRELEQPVRITYYLSDRLRARAPETGLLVDLLREYATHSRGMVSLSILDPVAAGLTADAEGLGIIPQQIQVIERDQQSLATVYTGIVIEYLDRRRVLPVVFDPSTFEYDVTSAIRNLVADRTPVIGILLGRREEDPEREYQILVGELGRTHLLRRIEIGEPIPPTIDALFVVGARDIGPEAVERIREFLDGGGNALLAVSGVDVDLDTPALPAQASSGSIFDLLRERGVNIRHELVLDRAHRTIPVTQEIGTARVQTQQPYPHWVSVTTANPEHPVTAGFSGLDLFWPSPIDVGLAEDNRIEVLFETTGQAWLMGEPFVTSPQQAAGFDRDARATLGRYVLGVALSHPGRLVVIGDDNFLSNLIHYTGSAHNIDVVERIAGWLTLDDDLASLRARPRGEARLDRIEDPSRRLRIGRSAAVLNTVVLPVAVVVMGVVLNVRRRRNS